MEVNENEITTGNRRHEFRDSSWKKQIRKRLPVLSWFPTYKRSDLTADVIAGVTVGLTVVPQSMAYAAIAGLSPEFGLYSAYIGCFLYVLLGSCKQVTIGPTAVMGLLTYETCGNDFPSCAVLTGFYAGVFELLMAILQLGWVVSFISESVVIGFTAGAATTIISSQVKSFLGLSGPKGSGFVGYWSAIFRDIHTISLADCCIGSISFVALLALRKLKDYKHPTSPHKKAVEKACWLLSVSRNVIIVVITSFIAFLWGNPPFKLTGHVHGGFPDIDIPPFNLPINITDEVQSANDAVDQMTFWQTWSFIGAGPLIVALIAILQNVAISKAFGSGQIIDATQEMFALGAANIVGSFFSSIPVSGSFSRSAVNESSGVRSPMGGLFTGLLVLLSLGFLTQSFYYIPKASLAAVIICAVMFMIEYESLPVMWKVNKFDAITCIVTYGSSIALGMEYGIMIGVATSIAVILIKMLKPDLDSKIMFDDRSSTNYILIKPPPGINFPSVDHMRICIAKLSRKNENINVIVLDLEKWEAFDYTAILSIKSISNTFKKEGKVLIFSNVSRELQDALGAAGLKDETLLSSLENIHDYLNKSRAFESIKSPGPNNDFPLNLMSRASSNATKGLSDSEINSVNCDGMPNSASVQTATNDVVKPLL